MRESKAFLVFAISIAIMAVAGYALMFYDMGSSSAAYHAQADRNSQNEAAATAPRIERECAARRGMDLRKCITQIVDASRQGQHDEWDLVSQRQMSKWAFWVLIVAGGQLLITAIGLVYLRGTLDATRQAVRDTGLATVEMQHANVIARDSMVSSQRAWVSVKIEMAQGFRPDTTHHGIQGFYCAIRGLAKNQGRAPARHIRFDAEIRLAGVGEPIMDEAMHAFCDDWRHRLTQNTSRNVGPTLFAGEDMPTTHALFLPQADIERFTAGQEDKLIHPFVVGCVSYETPHVEGVRQTRFAYSLILSRAGHPFVIDAGEDTWWTSTIHLADHEVIEAD